MKLYTRSSRGYQSTDGMDEATVTRLLAELGATAITFIDEVEYNTAIAALQVK
jgi:hypothetical protein